MADLSQGLTVWLTGLPSAGKTTLAHALVRFLETDGAQTPRVVVVRADGTGRVELGEGGHQIDLGAHGHD